MDPKELERRIQIWQTHLVRNPQETIDVVATLAATCPYLDIEEDDDDGKED